MSDLLSPLALTEQLGDGAVILRGFCANEADDLIAHILKIARDSPFRKMKTPGGQEMSAAMTSCGPEGWITDRAGYRYVRIDPITGDAWPEMPRLFSDLARRAAEAGGFENFAPDSCLINRYEARAKMGLHQDKDERDFSQPIVSVSLGASATFLWGGLKRADKYVRIKLDSGDVVVWGGPARLVYHGVAPIKDGVRYNLTFRRAM